MSDVAIEKYKFLFALSREFGQGLILLLVGVIALSYALQGIYSDFKSGNAVIVELVRSNSNNDAKLTSALTELSQQVGNNTRAIESLMRSKHRPLSNED